MTAKATTVYTFKVALTYDKQIWRRIAMRGDQTLEALHHAIFGAFDRDDSHLYSFYLPKPGSRGLARRRDAAEYTAPYIVESDPWGDKPLHNAATTTLEELPLKKRQTFDYLFDFGDNWEHVITVQATDGTVEPGAYPRILEKHGESPPQYPDWEDDEEED